MPRAAAVGQADPGASEGVRRSLTVGIVLGVTLVAFESLAVVTIAPLMAEDLGGFHLYGWLFSGFLLASLFGIVAGGHLADTGSLATPLALGLAAFGVGLVLSAAAPSMQVVIVGRVLQGLGGGALNTVMLTAVYRAYPDEHRARIIALANGAWVIPSLLGPAIAGVVAETLGWRLVFWGILPLLVLVTVLTVPRFRELRPTVVEAPALGRLVAALLLAVGTGLIQAGLGGGETWQTLFVLPGAAAALYGLRRLMPAGFLRLRRGPPAIVATRGLLYATVVGIEAFLAFTLTAVFGYTSGVTGAVVAVGSVSWAVGSWLQARLEERGQAGRERRMRVGGLVTLVSLGALLAALFMGSAPLPVVVIIWFVVGLAVGMAHSTASVVALFLAPEGKEGRVSSALAISDQWASAVCTGVGGALLALAGRLAWPQHSAAALAMASVLVFGVLGMLATMRTRPA